MARWFVDRLPQRGIPSVSLRRLLPEAQFVGCADWKVSGCTNDHRRLDPGQLFVATRMGPYDGHAFVREALDRGAAGVIVERPCPEAGRLQVVVPDAREAHSRLCQALAGDPSQRLAALGVTGTFGKTVTSLFLRSILEAAGLRSGLIGAMGWSDGLTTRPMGAGLTAPSGQSTGHWPGGAAGLASILAYMVDQKCDAGVIEVPTEALTARCFEGVGFQAAVVSDIGVPYGMPTEMALQARRAMTRLFRKVVPGGAVVVNADDPMAEVLGGVNLDARRVSFGLKPHGHVDVAGRITRLDSSGTRFELLGFDRPATVELRLIGPRQVSHALAAAAMAWSLEIELDVVVAGLEALANVAGHLEAVNEGQDFDVRVDGAQSASALSHALTASRAVAAGQVHCVVSAEGGQDLASRRALAEVAERQADRVILTLGNPRTEDPLKVLDDLLAGFRRPGLVRVEPDRRSAIEAVIADGRSGDAILIAGKGRDGFQIFADRVVPFDDFDVARSSLRRQAALMDVLSKQRSA